MRTYNLLHVFCSSNKYKQLWDLICEQPSTYISVWYQNHWKVPGGTAAHAYRSVAFRLTIHLCCTEFGFFFGLKKIIKWLIQVHQNQYPHALSYVLPIVPLMLIVTCQCTDKITRNQYLFFPQCPLELSWLVWYEKHKREWVCLDVNFVFMCQCFCVFLRPKGHVHSIIHNQLWHTSHSITLNLSYNLDPITMVNYLPCIAWLLWKSGQTQSRQPMFMRWRRARSSHWSAVQSQTCSYAQTTNPHRVSSLHCWRSAFRPNGKTILQRIYRGYQSSLSNKETADILPHNW